MAKLPPFPPSFLAQLRSRSSTFQALVTHQFGLGSPSAKALAALVGLSPLSIPSSLPPSLLGRLERLPLPWTPLLGRPLKKRWLGRLRLQRKLGTLSGLRHGLRLPVRGQRTHSNGRTARRVLPPSP